jgi:pSer/pThr/pTyr-binding forkhead associated (FHA) protein
MSIKCICGHENPPGSSWCEDCGKPLQRLGEQPPSKKEEIASPPSVGYRLVIKNNAIEVNEPTRVFGRQDFTGYLPKEELQLISRKHFTISKENEKFFIQDGVEDGGTWKDSSNGTSLNGVPVKGAGKKELNDNDKVVLADAAELKFTIKK